MRKNKTAKMGIVVAILLLTVAFAAVVTNLTINGTASVKANSDEFARNIKFSTATETKPYLTVNGVTSEENVPTVAADGKSITFTAPAFDTIGNNAELHYWIVNESTNYNAELGELTCEVTSQNEEVSNEYIKVTPKNNFRGTTLQSGTTTTSNDSVKVEMVKSYVGDAENTYDITCSIQATGSEK